MYNLPMPGMKDPKSQQATPFNMKSMGVLSSPPQGGKRLGKHKGKGKGGGTGKGIPFSKTAGGDSKTMPHNTSANTGFGYVGAQSPSK